jgi:ferrous iron transport protein B
MRFVLIGQPNCGKSTLFNQVAGYRAQTGNFSGTTITYTESKVRVLGEVVQLVDLPGSYTLAGTNPAEREVLKYLAYHQVDVIINVVDASHLSQGLNLTLELLELEYPIVLALNMMDEAARLGMVIDGPRLSRVLGVEVCPLIASRGRGVQNVFTTALGVAREKIIPVRSRYSQELEVAIQTLSANINGRVGVFSAEPVAIKLLEGNLEFFAKEGDIPQRVNEILINLQDEILTSRGQPAIWALSGERHALATKLTREVVNQGEPRNSIRDRLDDVLLHPLWGYVALGTILWLFFKGVYGFGSALELPLLQIFDNIALRLSESVGQGTLWAEILTGTIQGISGGIAIVFPYLLPFLFGLGFLEDVGYLPRLAFLMDALMHRLGLHGKAIVPFILGYGCNVPAVMSTRMLEEKRDRFLAATLATLVPCAARLAVVFGLVAFYLGPQIALLIYLFNLLVIALTGKLLSHMMPEDTPGLILEIPVYRLPTFRTVAHKTWFRAKEFVVEAWPLLIIGSITLALLERIGITRWFNLVTKPLTWVLGLPDAVGVPLIFGILRKELSLIMLRQALGVADFSDALSPAQMISFTVFIVFYVPCLGTLAALRRELGTRDTVLIALLTVVIAVVTAVLARGAAVLFL